MSDKIVVELIEKLGTTEAIARQLIEIGEPALPLVDACAADSKRPNHIRQAASIVAHHIRDRMTRAPAAPAAHAAERSDGAVEARAWLARGRQIGGDGFQRHDAHEFVDSLYRAGATHVTFTEGENTLIVHLPQAPAARDRLFAIYNAEVDELGEEFGGEDARGHEMTLEEAKAFGIPEAVGEWVVDDLHVHDTGQSVLRFWWD